MDKHTPPMCRHSLPRNICPVCDKEALTEAVKVLSEALGEVMVWIDNWNPSFTEDEEWEDAETNARAALTRAKELMK